jgi:hypothetical protein
LRDPWTSPDRVSLFHVDDGGRSHPGWAPWGPASSASWTRRAVDTSAEPTLDEGSTALMV